MVSNSVVLPAPLGPMSPRISPAGTDSDAAFTAITLAERDGRPVGYAAWDRGSGYGESARLEVLDLVAAGRANPQIAAALYVSPKTVRNVVSAIFAKLHVADRAEAIVRAREAGLGRLRGSGDR